MYCEYSTGSGFDRKNQPMCEAERVADWVVRHGSKCRAGRLVGYAAPRFLECALILFRWLIAMPDCIARALETGWTAVVGVPAARWAATQGTWRQFERGSLARGLPHLCCIGWMTYCLGRGWTSAAQGLLPALAARATGRDIPRLVVGGVPCFIRDDHFLSCSEWAPGYKFPALGAGGHSTDFSMPAYAADL